MTPQPDNGASAGQPQNTPKSLDELAKRHPEVTLKLTEGPNGITVDKISVTPELQQQGHGTRALEDLIAYPDETGQALGATTAKLDGGKGANKGKKASG